MSTARITDTDGHTWPVTGHWCDICGMPLIRAHYGQTTHPTCKEKQR